MLPFIITENQSPVLYHRRLFTSLDLRSFLADRHRLACQQFVKGSEDSVPHLLVERLLERFEVESLKLHEVELRECIEIEDEDPEYLFSVRFSGDPILWDCSPTLIEDRLPAGLTLDEWFLPVGETLGRPYGENFRDWLFVVTSEREGLRDLIDEINCLINLQKAVLANSAAALALDLHSLVSKDGSIH